MIKAGQVVKIKPEWQDEGDDKITFTATADQYDTPDGPRVMITAEIGLYINPTQIVRVDMLEGN